jgi:hypothetical protein
MKRILAAAVLALTLTGCTWVPHSPFPGHCDYRACNLH